MDEITRDTSFYHSDLSKRKLSDMRRGELNPFFGRKHTPEAKAKMAAWTRNFNHKRQYDLQGITIKNLPTELWAYVAGLVDGEGSIAIKRSQVQICIYNCCEQVMIWLKENIGGQYRAAHRGGRTPNFCWNIGGARNITFALSKVQQFIIIKRPQLHRAQTFLEEKYGDRLNVKN